MRRLSDYLKEQFGEKVYRLSLSSGCSCPNRDGTVGTGGCTFCSQGGSGEFAAGFAPIGEQIDAAKKRIADKTDAGRFVAYFQSFTNTYGDPERLLNLYREAIERDDVVALSLGTRPDCLGDGIMDMLMKLQAVKPVWIELGLQTIHDRTARAFHRGYDLPVFEDAYRRLKEKGFSVIVHVILGLPGETREDMLDTARYLAALDPPLDGIKLQMLQVLSGTAMGEAYEQAPFPLMSLEEYADLVADCVRILPEDTVLHRMTGDGPRRLLIAPKWSLDKKRVLNTINRVLQELEKNCE
ncbi:MAG: TIGR01212 family radical SAM protein [Lachnospiraceae bacterium]|nr:TIGR01212 family radical SAM protein [Lachnospiraceae bacterium]